MIIDAPEKETHFTTRTIALRKGEYGVAKEHNPDIALLHAIKLVGEALIYGSAEYIYQRQCHLANKHH